MDEAHLATGFARVDDHGDRTAYTRCLALLERLPYFRDYKRKSFERLALGAGLAVLEVGCGLGDDARQLARRVGPSGLVLALDASAVMLGEARARTPAGAPVRFALADARALPFPADRFDRCRVDRTLQHIAEPRQAIGEMVRVLRPGGRLLAYDNDWGSFALSGSDEETTRILAAFWGDAFPSRWIGRHLRRHFLAAGLGEVTLYPSVSVITDFELADRVYSLRQTARLAVTAGRLAAAAAGAWLADLEAQSRAGGFLCALTAYTAVGTKPGPVRAATARANGAPRPRTRAGSGNRGKA